MTGASSERASSSGPTRMRRNGRLVQIVLDSVSYILSLWNKSLSPMRVPVLLERTERMRKDVPIACLTITIHSAFSERTTAFPTSG